MKTFSKILILSFTLCLISCQQAPRDNSTLYVNNETEHTIEIKGYGYLIVHEKVTEERTEKIFTIQANSSYTQFSNDGYMIFNKVFVDSQIIIFDNQKAIILTCYDLPRDCQKSKYDLSYSGFYKANCNNSSCTYNYTFTEKDYEFATPLME